MSNRIRWAARRLRRALTHHRCPHRDTFGRRCCYWHRRGEHNHHEHVGKGTARVSDVTYTRAGTPLCATCGYSVVSDRDRTHLATGEWECPDRPAPPRSSWGIEGE